MQIDHPITIALTLFAILLLAFFLVVPEYNTFVSLQTDLSEQKAEFNAKFDYYAAISKAHFDLQNHQEDVKKIDDALPQGFDLGEIIYSLKETAQTSGLIVKNLFLSRSSSGNIEDKAGSSLKDIIFSIDLLGNYEALQSFLKSLENSSRIFEVTNISFGSVSGQALQIFSLQIKTYSY